MAVEIIDIFSLPPFAADLPYSSWEMRAFCHALRTHSSPRLACHVTVSVFMASELFSDARRHF
jgi:hypothetical protein